MTVLAATIHESQLVRSFEPNLAKHPAVPRGACVTMQGAHRCGAVTGRWSVTDKVAQAGRWELWGSVLALPRAVWPQTGTCPSLGLSPPRSAAFKLGGRALEF